MSARLLRDSEPWPQYLEINLMSTLNRREMIQRSAACGVGAVIGEAAFSEQALGDDVSSAQRANGASPIQTRMFWTWDHSTEWALNRPGAHTHGSCNEYGRSTDSFVQDYTALLRWCGWHKIDAVVVWGLLRDGHGGLESAKRLCDVAAKETRGISEALRSHVRYVSLTIWTYTSSVKH